MGAGPHFAGFSHDGSLAGRDAAPPMVGVGSLDHVRGLVFDFDDVLHDATLWQRWLAQLLTRLGCHVSYAALVETWDQQYIDAVHRGTRTFDDALHGFLTGCGLTRGLLDEVLAACHARRRELATAARPLPGVRSTLARLRESGYAFVVLCDTDQPAGGVREQLVALGLTECFLGAVSSHDLGRVQPDQLCYTSALNLLGCDAAEAAYVGHSARALSGARRAGMRTIAFNFEPDAPADVHLGRFDELLRHLPSALAPSRRLQGAV